MEGHCGAFLFLFADPRGIPTWLYITVWAILSLGIWVLLAWQLRTLAKSIRIASQQQLVRQVIEGRQFLVEHPDLVDLDPTFIEGIERSGGLKKYFVRRNVISTLEMLYFHRKADAVDKEFFVSQCNHMRPWFNNPAFEATWMQTTRFYSEEFVAFVSLLKTMPAEQLDPWKSLCTRIMSRLKRRS
jgi:hypothetical protein